MANSRLTAAIKEVEALIAAGQEKLWKEKKLAQRKQAAKKPRAPKKPKVAATAVVTATAEEWQHAHKIVAAFTPNLRILRRRIARGVMTVDEVVDAVSEALKKARVSLHLIAAIAEVLRDSLMEDMTIDILDDDSAVA